MTIFVVQVNEFDEAMFATKALAFRMVFGILAARSAFLMAHHLPVRLPECRVVERET